MSATFLRTCQTPGRAFYRVIATSACLFLMGCRRDEIAVYSVPKDRLSNDAVLSEGDRPAAPKLHWATPPGWEQKEGTGMRVASFLLTGKNGQQAEVTVIPFPGSAGTELDNVNRWRREIGLDPVSAGQAGSEKVSIGNAEGRLFEFAGKTPMIDQKFTAGTIAAVLERDGTTWFFKVRGEQTTVAEAKPAFLEFLKSISFDAGASSQVASAAPPVSTNAKRVPAARTDQPIWDVPRGWQEQPAPPRVLNSFSVADNERGKATVSISAFPGEVGGPLANLNRWRNQLGLDPVEEKDLPRLTSAIDVIGGKAMLVDMAGKDAKTGRPARMVAVMVPREGRTWFYKMMGDDQIVAEQKEAFLKFVQTVRYPNA